MPRPVKNLLICAGWLAVSGLAQAGALAYIATVSTKDTVRRWREWVTA